MLLHCYFPCIFIKSREADCDQMNLSGSWQLGPTQKKNKSLRCPGNGRSPSFCAYGFLHILGNRLNLFGRWVMHQAHKKNRVAHCCFVFTANEPPRHFIIKWPREKKENKVIVFPRPGNHQQQKKCGGIKMHRDHQGKTSYGGFLAPTVICSQPGVNNICGAHLKTPTDCVPSHSAKAKTKFGPHGLPSLSLSSSRSFHLWHVMFMQIILAPRPNPMILLWDAFHQI